MTNHKTKKMMRNSQETTREFSKNITKNTVSLPQNKVLGSVEHGTPKSFRRGTRKIPFSDPTRSPIFFNTCFEKGALKTFIGWFLQEYGEKKTVDLVETLKQVGFHQATRAGVSLGLDDLKIPPQKAQRIFQASQKVEATLHSYKTGRLTSVEKTQQLLDTWNQTSEKLRQEAVQNFRTTNPVNPVYMMAFSGARGNISQVRQLVAMRGLMADPQGAILEFPIQSNFREGLTLTEYLISSYGARKGLVDTALRTATSGYLTRRLVDAAQHVVVHIRDCRTPLGITIKEKKLEQRLLGRVTLSEIVLNSNTTIKKNTLISQGLARQLAAHSKPVSVRSPLTCILDTSVCQLCYGADLAQGRLVNIGEAVGIVAGQSIGEPGTQLTMRTFHTGGVGVFSEKAMKSFTAPFSGKVEFLQPVVGVLVRTPQGNSVYLVKGNSIDETKPLLRLSGTGNQVYEIHSSEVSVGSLLWVKQGEEVKQGQLLAQVSRLETTQELPESSHPVRSPFDGQVVFLSMPRKLRKVFDDDEDLRPNIPFLSELGSFWVFSSTLHKEPEIADSFFLPGDLISRETPIQQYNLHLCSKNQVKQVHGTLVFGSTLTEFLVSKISYSRLFYFLKVRNQANDTSLVVYTKTPKQTILKWYPCLETFQSRNLGYYAIFSAGFQSRGELSSFWSPHQVYKLLISQDQSERRSLMRFEKQKTASSFLISQTLFTKNGFFQILNKKGKYTKKDNRSYSTFVRNPLQKQTPRTPESSFLKTALQRVREKIFQKLQYQCIYKPKVWFSYPTSEMTSLSTTCLSGVILGPGKNFDGSSFENFYVSTNLVSTKILKRSNAIIRSSELKAPSWFSIQDLTQQKTVFKSTTDVLSAKGIKIGCVSSVGTKRFSNLFTFYKLAERWIGKPKQCLHRKRRVFSILCFQKSTYQGIPDARTVKQNWVATQTRNPKACIHSPLFTKQQKTIFSSSSNSSLPARVELPTRAGWFFASQLAKVTLSSQSTILENVESTAQTMKILGKMKQDEVHGSKSEIPVVLPSFRLFVYRHPLLDSRQNFAFQAFENGWVLPDYGLTRAFRTSPVSGEFRCLRRQNCTKQMSVLTNQNVKTVKFPTESSFLSSNTRTWTPFVGNCIRWGQEIDSGFAVPLSGEIVKITSNSLTIRNGIPLLGSLRGLVHIHDNQFVDKNQLLLTLKSKRLETEDIVQGIPKIEQLFEARETQAGYRIPDNIHVLLQNHFDSLRKKLPEALFARAVRESILYIQRVLVEKIVEAYSNQGVEIAEKHVEVVVRQMTNRVRITKPGSSGLLPGEFVPLFFVEKLNSRRRQKKSQLPGAQYEPVILGISKSVLHSESFLHAASFQRVSQVLIQSAVARKTDFLKGLHENLLVGQLLPVGTGLFTIDRPETTEQLRLESYKAFLNKVVPGYQYEVLPLIPKSRFGKSKVLSEKRQQSERNEGFGKLQSRGETAKSTNQNIEFTKLEQSNRIREFRTSFSKEKSTERDN